MAAAKPEERAEKEFRNLLEEQKQWEEFYSKFKNRLDEFSRLEERAQQLEDELRSREKLIKRSFQREKYRFALITFFYIAASLYFVRTTYQLQNIWLFFASGVLVGIGLAFLAAFWFNLFR